MNSMMGWNGERVYVVEDHGRSKRQVRGQTDLLTIHVVNIEVEMGKKEVEALWSGDDWAYFGPERPSSSSRIIW